ncbi:MAG: universal stress protein [Haloferacaceae archaeon]
MERLLVAVDGSPPSEAALDFAAEEWPDADLVLLHVIDPVEGGYSASAVGATSEAWYEREREDAAALLESAADGVDGEPETRVEVGRPAATIVEAAADEDADGVVVGSHGRNGVSRVLLGSVAEAVVRQSTVPVTVVR